jgi:hypothetical protein
MEKEMSEVIPFRRRPPPSVVEPVGNLDVVGHLVVAKGTLSALNLTALTVIKSTPGRLCKVIVIDGGTSGAFVLSDCAAVGAASAGNTIWTLGFGVTAGTIFDLDWPCAVGITLSAVPSGPPIIAVSFS